MISCYKCSSDADFGVEILGLLNGYCQSHLGDLYELPTEILAKATIRKLTHRTYRVCDKCQAIVEISRSPVSDPSTIVKTCMPCSKDEHHQIRNAQLPLKEQPRVWEKLNPETGQMEYRYPGRADTPMPGYYKDMGFSERRFKSYPEHQRFCKEQGLVNHAAEGVSFSRSHGGAINKTSGSFRKG
jgi:hypothetical protein